MLHISSIRIRALIGTAVVGLGFLGFSSAVPASATVMQSSTPAHAQGYSGDAFIYLSSPSGGKVYLQGWAYHETFTGQFHPTGPNGLSKWSPNQKWISGKTNYWQVNGINAVVGKYCMTAWEGGSGGSNWGTACESIK